MFKDFVEGFLNGMAWVIIIVSLLLVIATWALPVVLAFAYSSWWLLSYGIIIPISFGVYNVFDNVPV